MVDLGAVDARSKAAAWAWYQHTAGFMATARSEVALAPRPHRSVRGCPSRFKLEADLLHSGARALDTSDRLESLHLPTNSSNSRSDGSMGEINISTVPSITTLVQDTDRHAQGVCTDLVVAASSSYGAASWDCGSALFDSFELVAMAKKLDDAHQLNQATMEKVCLPHDTGAGADAQVGTSSVDADEVEEEEEKSLGDRKLAALDTAALPNELSSPSSLTGIKDLLHGLSIDTHPVQLSPDQMQYRQAVYDMFCRYDNPEPQEGMLSEDVDLSTGEKMKKLKLAMSPVTRSKQQHRLRRLHSLSRAFRRHIAHLAGHVTQASSTAHWPLDKLHLSQSLSSQADSLSQSKHQAHFYPAESTAYPRSPSHKTVHAVSPRVGGGIKSMGSPFREYPSPRKSVVPQARINKSAGSPFGESPPFETCGSKAPSRTLRKQYSSDSVHHHYHHHYHHHHHHYLFRRHSDEGFAALPEPLLGADKSLLVAAAGLGMAKISSLQDYLSLNPKLEGSLLDCKRNTKDANMTMASLIQSPSPPSLHV